MSIADMVQPFAEKNCKFKPTDGMLDAPHERMASRNEIHPQLNGYAQGVGCMEHCRKQVRAVRKIWQVEEPGGNFLRVSRFQDFV